MLISRPHLHGFACGELPEGRRIVRRYGGLMRLMPWVIVVLGCCSAGSGSGNSAVDPEPQQAPRKPAQQIIETTQLAAPGQRPANRNQAAALNFTEGKDYVVLERHRFLDEERFDRPVEAFSMLFPRGWKIEGGVKWRGTGECRADIASMVVKATSPDGAIVFQVIPTRTFTWSSDSMILKAMQSGARSGGCAVNQAFDARQYVEGYARKDLGAQVSDVRVDDSLGDLMRKFDEQANSIARQYGDNTTTTSTGAFGRVTWPDGTEGLLHVAVTARLSRTPNAFSGGVNSSSMTAVSYCALMRYPPARKDEALKLYGMIAASHRMNPIWTQAKTELLNKLGNAEHAQRMETIRLVGERSKAYARAANEASDQRMRNWESQQASQDRQHTRFVQTIREVETWKGADGPVDLSSGYKQAWGRGNGSYILSNNPNFDPSRVFQDQNWQEMKRANP